MVLFCLLGWDITLHQSTALAQVAENQEYFIMLSHLYFVYLLGLCLSRILYIAIPKTKLLYLFLITNSAFYCMSGGKNTQLFVLIGIDLFHGSYFFVPCVTFLWSRPSRLLFFQFNTSLFSTTSKMIAHNIFKIFWKAVFVAEMLKLYGCDVTTANTKCNYKLDICRADRVVSVVWKWQSFC